MRVFAKSGERLIISNIHVEVDKATSISALENYYPIPSPPHRLSQADAMILIPRPPFLFQVLYTQFSKLLASMSIISLRNYQYIQYSVVPWYEYNLNIRRTRKFWKYSTLLPNYQSFDRMIRAFFIAIRNVSQHASCNNIGCRNLYPSRKVKS